MNTIIKFDYFNSFSLNRKCIKTTTLSDKLTIPKGTIVILGVYLLQHDPKYWDDPEKFNPDRLACFMHNTMHAQQISLTSIYTYSRFVAEERAKRPTTVHMPFGFGPRNCIGMRFALLEAKVALINLLQKYSFVRAPDTEVKYIPAMIIMIIIIYDAEPINFIDLMNFTSVRCHWRLQ